MARQRQPWYRKSTGWWMVEINGKQHRLAKGRENRRDAETQFHRLMVELDANPGVEGSDTTVASLLEEYLINLTLRNRSKRTVYERRRYLQLFAEEFGQQRIGQIKAFHLEKWVLSHPTWKSPETKTEAVKSVKAAFNWAVRAQLIEKNPFAHVTMGYRVRRRPATRREFAQLMRGLLHPTTKRADDVASKRRLREILTFILFTGARPSEVASLRWRHVDLTHGVITLLEHKTTSTQRSPSPRRIFLVAPVIRLLKKVSQRQDHSDFVFVNTRSRPWARNSIQQNLKRVRERIGLPDDLSLYSLRHLFGTTASMNGVELATLSQIMGHTSSRMTEHYIHLAGQFEHLHKEMNRATGNHHRNDKQPSRPRKVAM